MTKPNKVESQSLLEYLDIGSLYAKIMQHGSFKCETYADGRPVQTKVQPNIEDNGGWVSSTLLLTDGDGWASSQARIRKTGSIKRERPFSVLAAGVPAGLAISVQL